MEKKNLKVISKEEFFRQIDAINEKRRKIKKQIENIDVKIGLSIQEQLLCSIEDRPHEEFLKLNDKIEKLADKREKLLKKLK